MLPLVGAFALLFIDRTNTVLVRNFSLFLPSSFPKVKLPTESSIGRNNHPSFPHDGDEQKKKKSARGIAWAPALRARADVQLLGNSLLFFLGEENAKPFATFAKTK